VDLRELVGELERQRLPRGGELRPLHDPAADGLSLYPLQREGLAPPELAEVPVRPRHRHAGLVRRLDHAVLVLERQRLGVMTPPARRAEQRRRRACMHIHCPGLFRGTAGQEPGWVDLDRPEQLGEPLPQLLLPSCHHADWPPSTTSVCPVT
jgi:hypothetical protein